MFSFSRELIFKRPRLGWQSRPGLFFYKTSILSPCGHIHYLHVLHLEILIAGTKMDIGRQATGDFSGSLRGCTEPRAGLNQETLEGRSLAALEEPDPWAWPPAQVHFQPRNPKFQGEAATASHCAPRPRVPPHAPFGQWERRRGPPSVECQRPRGTGRGDSLKPERVLSQKKGSTALEPAVPGQVLCLYSRPTVHPRSLGFSPYTVNTNSQNILCRLYCNIFGFVPALLTVFGPLLLLRGMD